MSTKSYKEHLRDQITNAEQAAGYLAECAKEDPETFTLAVRDVWEFAQFHAAQDPRRAGFCWLCKEHHVLAVDKCPATARRVENTEQNGCVPGRSASIAFNDIDTENI